MNGDKSRYMFTHNMSSERKTRDDAELMIVAEKPIRQYGQPSSKKEKIGESRKHIIHARSLALWTAASRL